MWTSQSLRALLLTCACLVTSACGSSSGPTDPPTGPPSVASVTFETSAVDLLTRATAQLEVTVRSSSGSTLTGKTPAFTSSNPQVATVNNTGIVTGVGEGTTTITATVDGVVGTATVTVSVLEAVSLTVGSRHTCILSTAGHPYCWGGNDRGQLGLGNHNLAQGGQPRPVATDLVFATIDAGSSLTCGTSTDGAAYCWGRISWGLQPFGQESTEWTTPTAVAEGLVFASVDAGSGHACGLTEAGKAYCWGSNAFNQLGDGGIMGDLEAAEVGGDLIFKEVSAASRASCGLLLDGSAYCWGSDEYGQLGNGPRTGAEMATPFPVAGGLVFESLSATSAMAFCGITASDEAFCWGRNEGGLLGDGTLELRDAPTPVSGGFDFITISLSFDHSCGVTTAGPAYCWGSNEDGQLGDTSLADSPFPVLVSGGESFQQVGAGYWHSCGLTISGRVLCWGANEFNQLGDNGASVSSASPAPIIGSR